MLRLLSHFMASISSMVCSAREPHNVLVTPRYPREPDVRCSFIAIINRVTWQMLVLYESECQPEGTLWAGGYIWSSPARKTMEKMLAYKVE